MTNEKIRLLPKKPTTKKEALEVLQSLKEAIENDSIVAFAAVGIEPDDITRMWASTTVPVTRLRMIGAMYHMLHLFEVDPD